MTYFDTFLNTLYFIIKILKGTIFSKLIWNCMQSNLQWLFPKTNVHFVLVLNFKEPIEITRVLSKFTLRPVYWEYWGMISRASLTVSSFPSSSNVVPSANRVILFSIPLLKIPLMFLLIVILIDKISAHIINKYGLMGSPFLQQPPILTPLNCTSVEVLW